MPVSSRFLASQLELFHHRPVGHMLICMMAHILFPMPAWHSDSHFTGFHILTYQLSQYLVNNMLTMKITCCVLPMHVWLISKYIPKARHSSTWLNWMPLSPIYIFSSPVVFVLYVDFSVNSVCTGLIIWFLLISLSTISQCCLFRPP